MIKFTDACTEILKKEKVNVDKFDTMEDYSKVYQQLYRISSKNNITKKDNGITMVDFDKLNQILNGLIQSDNSAAITYKKNVEELKNIFGMIEYKSDSTLNRNEKILKLERDLENSNNKIKALEEENEQIKLRYKQLCNKLINNENITKYLDKDEIIMICKTIV